MRQRSNKNWMIYMWRVKWNILYIELGVQIRKLVYSVKSQLCNQQLCIRGQHVDILWRICTKTNRYSRVTCLMKCQWVLKNCQKQSLVQLKQPLIKWWILLKTRKFIKMMMYPYSQSKKTAQIKKYLRRSVDLICHYIG